MEGMTLVDENVLLKAENAALREQVSMLVSQVQDLQARLAKDSHNSNKPPSSDVLARKTKRLRRRSGKKPGGQIGHHGDPGGRVACPEAVEEHGPASCSRCEELLTAEAAVVLRERRQLQELPRVRLEVIEHQVRHLRCPACQAVTAGT